MWQEMKKELNALVQKINNLSLDEKLNLMRQIVEDKEINYTYKCVVEFNEIKKSLLDGKHKDATYHKPVQFAFDDFEAAAKSITSKEIIMRKHSKDGVDHYPELGKTIVRFYSSYELARKQLDRIQKKVKNECPTLCYRSDEENKNALK